ncbi:putative Ig domain-containing protein [Nocardioides pinisoli]|uniref:Uncharacterized protein n=1 Tax=Nocardioides pinisoli TaxID=2950279 RepID=A0ABT1KYR8_9ACTN|nr:putative Ig domain-containing protein [Nocardioides pinisoli]MCP3422411.1 hypothetical protein [Nocardioides pinisoli]
MSARRWLVLLVAGALTTSGLAAVPASAGPGDVHPRVQAARPTKLTLRTSAEEAVYGSRVTLSGKLTAGRTALKRQKVVIRQRTATAKGSVKVATATTDRRGRWRATVTVRVRSTWVATYKGTRTWARSTSPKRQVDVFAPLTDFAVAPGGRDAYKDEDWTFTARTAPELAGRSVRLLRGPFRAPTTLRTATIGPGGAVAITHRMAEVGQADYWVSVDGSALMYGADSPRASIRTRAEGAPTMPSIATASLPTTEVHVPYQANLVGGGGELTWSALSALPPGLDLSPAGVVSGAPSQVGTWQVDVRATNVVGSATRTVSFTSAPGSLTVTTWPLEDGAVGVDYPEGSFTSRGEQELSCTPCPDGATWSVTAGALPPGLEMDYDDLIEESYVFGRPTVAGLYTFTATAVLGGRSGSRTFTIRVLPSAAELLRIYYDPRFEDVPPGEVGQPYTHQLTTVGNQPGVTWSSLAELPPGLTLSPSGVLSGTPTVAGYGWLYVAVTDGTRYDWQGLSLTVAP